MGATPTGVSHALLMSGGNAGLFTVVEFDVSVVAEAAGGAKGSLKVWSVGIEGGGHRSNQETSRVKFAVQVKIPKGEASPPSPHDRDINYLPPGVA